MLKVGMKLIKIRNDSTIMKIGDIIEINHIDGNNIYHTINGKLFDNMDNYWSVVRSIKAEFVPLTKLMRLIYD